jgi:hypothetical protein
MSDVRHPSETERAVSAIVLGLILGAFLALAGRRRTRRRSAQAGSPA